MLRIKLGIHILSVGILIVLSMTVIGEWFFAQNLRWLYIFLLSLLFAHFFTLVFRYLARELGILDWPALRKVHQKATPLLGGIAVYIGFAVGANFTTNPAAPIRGIFIGATLIMLMGLVDDVHHLPAWLKLVIQLLAAGIMIRGGVVFTFLPQTWWGLAGEIILTVIWVVGITNALNFLDGLDGLATGLTAICAFFFCLAALRTGQEFFVLLSVALLGSCLGFLPFNFRPKGAASIFLGDAGSMFLGFTLAGVAIMGEWGRNNAVDLAVPLLILGVPIFDMTMTTIMRIKDGQVRNFSQWLNYIGKDHYHHRLMDLGLGPKGAVLMVFLTALWLGLGALVLKNATGIEAVFSIVQALIVFALISFFMIFIQKRHVRRQELTPRN